MLEQLAQGTFDTGFLKISYGPDTPAELIQSELEEVAKVPQQNLFIDFNACDNFDVSEQLRSLNIPILILVGDKDKMTPLRNSQFLNQNIVNSVLKVIPGSGHNLMLEKPQETRLAVQEFLNEKLA
jgi:pimeloyl-ACP methyl ester carboxylesterase